MTSQTRTVKQEEQEDGPPLDGTRVRWAALRQVLLQRADPESPAGTVPAALWGAAQEVALQHTLQQVHRAVTAHRAATDAMRVVRGSGDAIAVIGQRFGQRVLVNVFWSTFCCQRVVVNVHVPPPHYAARPQAAPTCGVSYVVPSESTQQGCRLDAPPLPPLTIQPNNLTELQPVPGDVAAMVDVLLDQVCGSSTRCMLRHLLYNNHCAGHVRGYDADVFGRCVHQAVAAAWGWPVVYGCRSCRSTSTRAASDGQGRCVHGTVAA